MQYKPRLDQPRETPPVGSGNVLTTPQIRYCTAQSIRLDAAKDALNQYDDSPSISSIRSWRTTTAVVAISRYRKGRWKVLTQRGREIPIRRYLAQGRQLFAPSTSVKTLRRRSAVHQRHLHSHDQARAPGD